VHTCTNSISVNHSRNVDCEASRHRLESLPLPRGVLGVVDGVVLPRGVVGVADGVLLSRGVLGVADDVLLPRTELDCLPTGIPGEGDGCCMD
jgi:hypothetical protein